MLADVGSWASIIGLVITFITLFVTSNVSKKVNGILKVKSDKIYFNKKVPIIINDLTNLQERLKKEERIFWSSTREQLKINNAMEVINCSWDVLLPYEGRIVRQFKIMSWKCKFKKIRKMYSGEIQMDSKEMVLFLNELITFVEKEWENNE